jgi:hypothetical protein
MIIRGEYGREKGRMIVGPSSCLLSVDTIHSNTSLFYISFLIMEMSVFTRQKSHSRKLTSLYFCHLHVPWKFQTKIKPNWGTSIFLSSFFFYKKWSICLRKVLHWFGILWFCHMEPLLFCVPWPIIRNLRHIFELDGCDMWIYIPVNTDQGIWKDTISVL